MACGGGPQGRHSGSTARSLPGRRPLHVIGDCRWGSRVDTPGLAPAVPTAALGLSQVMRDGASFALRQPWLERPIGVDDLIVAATSRRTGRRWTTGPASPQRWFRQHPCLALYRALFEVRDRRGGLALVAVAWVDMPDVAQAVEFKQLVDRSGTGKPQGA